MIPPRWKGRLQLLLNRFGYRIERLRPTSGDPFQDQLSILSRCGVVATTVFDLGAHVGVTVQRFRSIFPQATIYAFEPSIDSFAKLSTLASHDALTKVYNVAVSDRDGFSPFHVFKHEQANSLLPIASAAGHYYDPRLFVAKGVAEVRTITLDPFCESERIGQVDILKLDVQGSELSALQGARRLLGEGRIALIYTETEFTQVYEGQATFYDMRKYLHEFGYEMFNLYGLCRGTNGRLVAADALFLRQDLVQRLLN
jgi:FkbM family methyltransferase